MLLGLAAPAHPATWYVRGNVRADSSGSCAGTFVGPCRYLSLVNARVAYGDTVDVDSLGHYNPSDTNTVISTRNRISPGGTYAGAFPPDRIVYRGRTDAPERVKVEGGLPGVPWLTAEGFWFAGATGIGHTGIAAGHDDRVEIDSCLIRGGSGFTGSKGSIVKNSTIAGNLWINTSTGSPVCAASPGSTTQRDTMLNNTIALYTDAATATIGTSNKGIAIMNQCSDLRFERNRFSGTFNNGTGSACNSYMMYVYNSARLTFRDNRWTAEATSINDADNGWHVISTRDSTVDLTFYRDTILAGLSSVYQINGHRIVQSGNPYGYRLCAEFGIMGPSSRITIEQCVVRSRLGTAMNPQVRLSGLTLRHNVVAGPGAFLLSGSGDGLSGVTVEWNTFFARGKSAFRVFEMPTPIGAVNTVRGNIFASTAPTSSDGIVDLRDSGGGAQGGTLFDRNVYWDYGAAGTNAITISGPDVTVVKTVGPSGTAGASYGWELDGKFANPVLTDTSYAAFNQHLRRSSAAAESLHAHVAPEAWLWATHPDSTAPVDQDERNDRYVGAPAPRDTMPPATPVISSLSASTAGGVLVKTITFTMAGDD